MTKETAMKILKELHGKSLFAERTALETLIPELADSKDEKIRKDIIVLVKDWWDRVNKDNISTKEQMISWLERQGGNNNQNWKPSKGQINALEHFVRSIGESGYASPYDDNTKLLYSLINDLYKLEKQGKHQQLYIRFGDIPSNEKSKIYRGEKEIGIENGVSVYPAFKSTNGDIVLGLNLPITKTTLHTQQHLLEYDNRPCYLVTGDYVGKDTDGQILISNVNIIEKIDNYRVKTEKQDDTTSNARYEVRADGSLSVNGKPFDYEHATITQKDFAPKQEPKFKVGDWISNGRYTKLIVGINSDWPHYMFNDGTSERMKYIDKKYHLWAFQDANEGNILAGKIDGDNYILIFKTIKDGWIETYGHYYNAVNRFCVPSQLFCRDYQGTFTPATKEQCDLLFQKMKEAGYEWDADKKELKKLTQSVTKKSDQATWSYEDEANLNNIIMLCNNCIEGSETTWIPSQATKIKHLIETIKERGLLQQKPTEWSDEDEAYKEFAISAVEDYYDEENPLQKELVGWLKSLKERMIWKPSKKQMETLEYYMHTLLATEHKEVLFGLYNDLKKL